MNAHPQAPSLMVSSYAWVPRSAGTDGGRQGGHKDPLSKYQESEFWSLIAASDQRDADTETGVSFHCWEPLFLCLKWIPKYLQG